MKIIKMYKYYPSRKDGKKASSIFVFSFITRGVNTGEWPTPWTQLLIITLPKKGNLQLCQNYRTISLISHSIKVMLKVILNRSKARTLLSPTLFNIFLERIMSDALEEHDGKVSIGGRNITNLRFADDIDALAEEEQELEALVESLDKTCTRYKMEISAEKTKLMTNSANGIQREIKVKGQKLGTVTSFQYLETVVSDDGSKPEVLSSIAQATAALTKLKPIWRDNNISLGSKVKLMRSLVIFIFLFACESWALTGELEKRTQGFAMRCYRRLLNISYKDHVTNEEVRRKIQAAIGEYDELLTLVKKR